MLQRYRHGSDGFGGRGLYEDEQGQFVKWSDVEGLVGALREYRKMHQDADECGCYECMCLMETCELCKRVDALLAAVGETA